MKMIQKKPRTIELLIDAVVEFKNGERVIIDAINISDRVVYIGHMVNDNEFMEGGGIPRENIKRIIGGKRKIVNIGNF